MKTFDTNTRFEKFKPRKAKEKDERGERDKRFRSEMRRNKQKGKWE